MTRDRPLMLHGSIPLPPELADLHPAARALWQCVGVVAMRAADHLLRFGPASPAHLAAELGATLDEVARGLDELTATGAASCVHTAGQRIYSPT